MSSNEIQLVGYTGRFEAVVVATSADDPEAISWNDKVYVPATATRPEHGPRVYRAVSVKPVFMVMATRLLHKWDDVKKELTATPSSGAAESGPTKRKKVKP